MRIATWNVNGVRARKDQLVEWVVAERPDVLCLQEIKASLDQVPPEFLELEGYWCCWHGEKGYSGVGLHVRRDFAPERPAFVHPLFDFECRVAQVDLANLRVLSVYVPNGGKDFPAKMRFLADLEAHVAETLDSGKQLLLCGDLNVTREEKDVHPKERSRKAVGQLPEEREAFARLLGLGLVDVARHLDPDNEALFTWWPPWRKLRERNVGWRIDYLLASPFLADRATLCRSLREVGTSDHAPVVLDLDVTLTAISTQG